jgi:hypothetical protein
MWLQKSPQKNTIEDSSDSNELLSVPEQSSEQSTIQEVQIEVSGSTSLSTTNDAPQTSAHRGRCNKSKPD